MKNILNHAVGMLLIIGLLITGGCSAAKNKAPAVNRAIRPAAGYFGHFNLDGTINDDMAAYQMHEPTMLPDGYVFAHVYENRDSKELTYLNGDADITIRYFLKIPGRAVFNPDAMPMEESVIHGIYSALYSEEEGNILYWDTGIIEYIITAEPGISQTEIILIADSIMG